MSSVAPLLSYGERIRVRGTVQGVGFRPTVWRIANALGVRGCVTNDGEGVLIEAWGELTAVDRLVERIHCEAPVLARIDRVERSPVPLTRAPADFRILTSGAGPALTQVVPDAAVCQACAEEIFDPFNRRFRYPFTNCTHCGPRLSIIESIPYDRLHTTMAAFAMCPECEAEYKNPEDRRFHAQPIACHACGPRLTLARTDGRPVALEALTFLDESDAGCTLLQRGQIIAVQGLGGYQLACDAASFEAVGRLRAGKKRERKPFALMARDLGVIRRYCAVSDAEAHLLSGSAAPIVLLDRLPRPQSEDIAPQVAPGVRTLGFMLPNTPLHRLLLRRMDRPIVLTSGNLADEPQCIERSQARARLSTVADYFIEHNRPIARRVDDSLARVVSGRTRIIRRARGYAPAPFPLPPGFEHAPRVLAFGGELKNTICLLGGSGAVLSPHIGDLEDAATRADYARALGDFRDFLGFKPDAVACDLHPNYSSTALANAESERIGKPCIAVQHHHAHIAACLAENLRPLAAAPVLGIVLDGLGFGTDGSFWGGEFLLADYGGFQRLATFKPVALLGGEAAMREPWRSTYAHLMAELGWAHFAMNYSQLDLYAFLHCKPREVLDSMLRRNINAPLASSCGRLFDAVGAAAGLVREAALFEGQCAVELEAVVDHDCLTGEDQALDYPFAIPRLPNGLPYVEPLAMWQALLGDLILGTPVGVIAARFHRGLASTIVRMAEQLANHTAADAPPLNTIALSGGVFQNRILFERVLVGLEGKGFTVLTHSQTPCNDGGLALGQAAVAAAQLIARS